jgi:hypothetical protein
MDVDLRLLVKQLAQHALDARAARLAELIAHPEAVAAGKPCTAGEAAECRHLLYDADPDAVVPAFPYPTPQETL